MKKTDKRSHGRGSNNKGAKSPAFRSREKQGQSQRKTRQTEPMPPVADMLPKGPMGAKNRCVGTLREGKPEFYVDPDPGYSFSQYGRIRIQKSDLNGAPIGMKVVCEILNPEATAGDYEGKVLEVLGDPGRSDVAILAILRQYGIPEVFPDAVLAMAEQFPTHPSDADISDAIKNGRRDLRTMRTVTIDGKDAKDLDDAISIDRVSEKGFRLFVHIADVSHYVEDMTAIDIEAADRGTSVYLVDRVVPMLPPRLSNGLCSLNPKVPRFTLSVAMTINYQGEILDGEIFESIIQSNVRATYSDVYDMLYLNEHIDGYEEMTDMFRDMKELMEILSEKRKRRGSIDFSFPETYVKLDEQGNPTDVFAYPNNEANGIIEEFMIVCNEYVADQFERMNYPFIYRIHEEPDERKISEFLHVARLFGAKASAKGKISPEFLANLMLQIRDEPFAPALSQLLLRSLAKARYFQKNAGHFGLNSEHYCHFTSPIRRYPDLYIHRIIKSYLHHEQKKAYYSGKVPDIAFHSSEMERNSVEAERASVDQKISEFMARHIGDSFDGIISGIFHAGIFVRLESTVEGMIAFRSMDDYYEFDERKLEARGKTGGKTYRIGQHIRVLVTAADPLLRRVDFSIEGSDHSAGIAEKKTSATKGRGQATVRNRKKGKRKRK